MTKERPLIPTVMSQNLFLDDPMGEVLWKHWIGETEFAAVRPHFVAMGESGALATPLSARADRLGPVLRTHDPAGERIDRVEFHPDYRRLEELSYGRGIVSLKYEPDFLSRHRAIRHLVGFGAGFYFAQTEIGVFCPICMTDGVGRVLERQAALSTEGAEALRRISSREMAELWQGSMYLTERQGGSDVGANTVTATERGGRWYLNGDKWFCSNVAADAILALARMPAGPAGTKGLGLFLVLRQRPERNGGTIRIHRIKEKLGVRSMPTGEVTFENTEATLIAGVGQGFKQMAEMLNLSRLYNAVASVAAMRRALGEAVAYGDGREAFGSSLIGLPLWRASMADLIAEYWGMFLLVFETVRALDRADLGGEGAKAMARLAIPMAKALSGKLSIFTVSECMEAIGGNAYIEESILPRLLRDCQVLPIWEGTTHILTLDALRAMEKERSHEALIARIELALSNSAGFPSETALVRERLKRDRERLKELSARDEGARQRAAREWLEAFGRTFTLGLLLEAASHLPARDVCLAAFQRLSLRPYGVTPVCSRGTAEQQGSEAALLSSIRCPASGRP